jgi:hypothetical protein
LGVYCLRRTQVNKNYVLSDSVPFLYDVVESQVHVDKMLNIEITFGIESLHESHDKPLLYVSGSHLFRDF